ncbi:MAG: hypothetical protein M1480_19110 [Bacteroidetes bacterium]|nr:hypothetical protein [Bacteroidota bacterium]
MQVITNDLEEKSFLQKIRENLNEFLRITYKSLLINLSLVFISFGISYTVINSLNQKISGEVSSVSLIPDSTLHATENSYELRYPDSYLSTEELKNLKDRLKLVSYNNVYPELDLTGKINKAELVALLEANNNWSIENKEALKALYTKSHPFGDQGVKHSWIFNFIPLVAFFLFLLVAFDAYLVMKNDYKKGKIPDSAAFEEVENSYLNIIDVMGFSVPLLGAAILLLSVIVGPMMFINFSIPFEIKAILVLILSKTFSIVIDSIGDEFRVKYYQLKVDEKKKIEESRLTVLNIGNNILEKIQINVNTISEKFNRKRNEITVPIPQGKVVKDAMVEVCHDSYGTIEAIKNKIMSGFELDDKEKQLFRLFEDIQKEKNFETIKSKNNGDTIKIFDDTELNK